MSAPASCVNLRHGVHAIRNCGARISCRHWLSCRPDCHSAAPLHLPTMFSDEDSPNPGLHGQPVRCMSPALLSPTRLILIRVRCLSCFLIPVRLNDSNNIRRTAQSRTHALLPFKRNKIQALSVFLPFFPVRLPYSVIDFFTTHLLSPRLQEV